MTADEYEKVKRNVARRIMICASRRASGCAMDIAIDYPSRVLDYHAELGVENSIPLGNMSVCRLSDDRFLVSVRQFNYALDPISAMGALFSDFSSNRAYHMAVVDRNFNFISACACPGLEQLEDLRLLRFGNVIQASGTDVSFGPNGYKIACLDFELQKDDSALVCSTKRIFPVPHEKNYIPIENKRGEFITDLMDGEFLTASTDDPARKRTHECIGLIRYSGSTQLLRYRDGYVALVHRRKRRTYLNAFAFFDRTLQQCRISSEFTVFGNVSPVNFTCGMVLDGETALLPVCVHDRETHLFELPLADFAKTARWRS